MLDETEFLSDYGVRALSKNHLAHPYCFRTEGQEFTVRYQPAESDSTLFGGNSNWRGPIWMPVNFLLIESLRRFHTYYGDDFKVECPTGSGTFLTIAQIADELTRRLLKIFQRDARGGRPVYNGNQKLRYDPNFARPRTVPRVFPRRQRSRRRRIAPDGVDGPDRHVDRHRRFHRRLSPA